MTEQIADDIPGQELTNPRYYSAAALPLIQSLLSTLADIELELEQECDKIRSITDSELKGLMLERLQAKHLARREPYVRRLALLQASAVLEEPQESAAS